MRKIKIEQTTYSIPQSWEEINVKQFDKVQAILRDKEEDEISLKVLAKIVCSITGLDMSTLTAAPKQVFDFIINELNFMFDGSHNEAQPATSVIIEGVRHSFPTDENQITFGQWVDVDEVVKGETILASIMAIMLLPEGESHDAVKYNERVKKMQALPCTAVLPLLNFFLSSGKEYTILFQSFLEAKVQGLAQLQHLESIIRNGDGMQQLHSFHKMIYLKWISLLKSQLMKC